MFRHVSSSSKRSDGLVNCLIMRYPLDVPVRSINAFANPLDFTISVNSISVKVNRVCCRTPHLNYLGFEIKMRLSFRLYKIFSSYRLPSRTKMSRFSTLKIGETVNILQQYIKIMKERTRKMRFHWNFVTPRHRL